jgi:hypothetical protein
MLSSSSVTILAQFMRYSAPIYMRVWQQSGLDEHQGRVSRYGDSCCGRRGRAHILAYIFDVTATLPFEGVFDDTPTVSKELGSVLECHRFCKCVRACCGRIRQSRCGCGETAGQQSPRTAVQEGMSPRTIRSAGPKAVTSRCLSCPARIPRANAGHLSLGQMKVMSAIGSCRTAAMSGAARTARVWGTEILRLKQPCGFPPSLGGQRGVPYNKITNKLGQSIRPLGQRRRTPEAA